MVLSIVNVYRVTFAFLIFPLSDGDGAHRALLHADQAGVAVEFAGLGIGEKHHHAAGTFRHRPALIGILQSHCPRGKILGGRLESDQEIPGPAEYSFNVSIVPILFKNIYSQSG